jgi:hypothetical protein
MTTIRRGFYVGSVGQVCAPHKAGVVPGHPPFFAAGCPKCEEKLAAGKVTGDEPHPRDVVMKYSRQRRRGWSLSTSTEGIVKRDGVAAGRAHRKMVVAL